MPASSIDSLLPDLGGCLYMNTASIGVACRASRKALVDAAGARAEGRFDFVAAERAGEEARCLFAELINARVDCVSLIPSASAVAGQVTAPLGDFPIPGNIAIGAQ